MQNTAQTAVKQLDKAMKKSMSNSAFSSMGSIGWEKKILAAYQLVGAMRKYAIGASQLGYNPAADTAATSPILFQLASQLQSGIQQANKPWLPKLGAMIEDLIVNMPGYQSDYAYTETKLTNPQAAFLAKDLFNRAWLAAMQMESPPAQAATGGDTTASCIIPDQFRDSAIAVYGVAQGQEWTIQSIETKEEEECRDKLTLVFL